MIKNGCDINDKIKIIFVASLMLVIVFFPSVNSTKILTNQNNNSQNSISKSSILYINSISSYDYGFKVGKQFYWQYKLLELFSRISKNNIDLNKVKSQINKLEQNNLFFLQELKGLSTSLHISVDRLLFIMELLHSVIKGECTTTLSTGQATKNNETFLTQNIDYRYENNNWQFKLFIARFINRNIKIVKINTMMYKYAYRGLPILLEFPLLNEKGLGFGGNGLKLTENTSREVDEGPGISTYMLERLSMMTCKNVSEVASLWIETERSSGRDEDWPHHYDNSMSVWCDKQGEILMIEQTHNYIITVFGDSTNITNASRDILWHANHHQWLDPEKTGSVYPEEYLSSKLREQRAHELLEENYGNITLEGYKKIVRDHDGGYDISGKDSGDICRHPDNNGTVITGFSWIIQSKSMTVHITKRSPCQSIFIKYDLSNKF